MCWPLSPVSSLRIVRPRLFLSAAARGDGQLDRFRRIEVDARDEVPEEALEDGDDDEEAEADAVGDVTEGGRVVEKAGASLTAGLVPQQTGGVDEASEQDGRRDVTRGGQERGRGNVPQKAGGVDEASEEDGRRDVTWGEE